MFKTTTTHTTPPSLPDIQDQLKLTKKQKKALAFRDKINKNKTKNTSQGDEREAEMEDLHVPDVEKPTLALHAGDSVQVAEMADQSRKGPSRGSKATSSSSKKAPGDTIPQRLTQETRPRQKSQQKLKRVDEVGVGQFRGDVTGESKKPTKKRKAEPADDRVDVVVVDGFRREGENTEEKASNKKRKIEKAESRLDRGEEEDSGEEEVTEEGREAEKGKKEQRFILFIGNLKYTTSVDAIQAHFSCDPPPEVRLLTPKASATGKTTTKSKGCAFLEFKNKISLQQALKLHHSMLDGRMINVELTAGGGGRGEKRMEKLRERNKELLGQRKKKVDKGKDGTLPSRPDKPQRYSGTSGLEQSVPNRKTWTVGETVEDEVHRGGRKHKKDERARGSRKSKMRDWVTGVNAIPVG